MAKVLGIPSFSRNKKLGRTFYFDKAGKFISYAKYLSLQRYRKGTRGSISAAEAKRRGSIYLEEKTLRRKFKGPPVGGKNWVTIANKYPERFAAFL